MSLRADHGSSQITHSVHQQVRDHGSLQGNPPGHNVTMTISRKIMKTLLVTLFFGVHRQERASFRRGGIISKAAEEIRK